MHVTKQAVMNFARHVRQQRECTDWEKKLPCEEGKAGWSDLNEYFKLEGPRQMGLMKQAVISCAETQFNLIFNKSTADVEGVAH